MGSVLTIEPSNIRATHTDLGIWQLQCVKSERGWLVSGTALESGGKPLNPTGAWWDVLVKTVRTYFIKPYRGRLVFRDDRARFEADTDKNGGFEFETPELVGNQLTVSADPRMATSRRKSRIRIFGRTKKAGNHSEKIHHYPTHFDYSGSETMIISDIDDTILVSKSGTFFSKLVLMLFKPVSKRSFVEETERAYRLLDKAQIPFIYVSASELNLFSTISNFLQIKELPIGPIYLRPHRNWKRILRTQPRPEYKTERIERVIHLFDRPKIVLFGDDSQDDPGVFKHISQAYPDRIRAVFIRETGLGPRGRDKVLAWDLPQSDMGVYTYSKFSQIQTQINLLTGETIDR